MNFWNRLLGPKKKKKNTWADTALAVRHAKELESVQKRWLPLVVKIEQAAQHGEWYLWISDEDRAMLATTEGRRLMKDNGLWILRDWPGRIYWGKP